MSTENRIEKLERQVRGLRMILIALGVVVVAGFALGAATVTGELRASKIIVPRAAEGLFYSHILTFEAEGGQKMAELQLRSHGPALWLYDNAGRQVLNLGASANDWGGYVHLEGKTSEAQRVQLNGRGFYLMGRPEGGEGATMPWIALDRFMDNYCRLIIRGKGAETITLDNVNGAPRVEVIGADGTQTWATP